MGKKIITEQDISKRLDIVIKPSDIVIGAIAGDIIGSLYEFNRIKSTEFPLFSEKSRFTDDTVMTIAILNALLEYDEQVGFTHSDKTTDWKKLNQLFISSMKTYGQSYPKAGYGSKFFYWLCRNSSEPYNSFGNGSAMRVSPVAAFFDNEDYIEHVSAASAAVTHNHPEGIKGAQAVADAIYLAKYRNQATKEKDEIKDIVNIKYGYNFFRTLDMIRPDYGFDETCQGSIPEALLCFFEGNSFEEVVRLAVSLGGDADTQAAISGSIAAARYGVPEEIKAEAIKRLPDDLLDVYNRFDKMVNPEKEMLRAKEWKSQTTPDT